MLGFCLCLLLLSAGFPNVISDNDDHSDDTSFPVSPPSPALSGVSLASSQVVNPRIKREVHEKGSKATKSISPNNVNFSGKRTGTVPRRPATKMDENNLSERKKRAGDFGKPKTIRSYLSYNNGNINTPTIFARECLCAHNNRRQAHGVPPLKWSAYLSHKAQSLANKLASAETLPEQQDKKIGENIHIAKGIIDLSKSCPVAVDSWYNEGKQYDYAKSGLSSQTAHFTQVIWKSSSRLGVGRAISPSGKLIIVARYFPPGNVPEQFKNNIRKPIEKFSSSSVRFCSRDFHDSLDPPGSQRSSLSGPLTSFPELSFTGLPGPLVPDKIADVTSTGTSSRPDSSSNRNPSTLSQHDSTPPAFLPRLPSSYLTLNSSGPGPPGTSHDSGELPDSPVLDGRTGSRLAISLANNHSSSTLNLSTSFQHDSTPPPLPPRLPDSSMESDVIGSPGTYSLIGPPGPLRFAPPAAASASISPGVNKPGPPSTSNSPASSLGGPPGNTNIGVSSSSVQPPGAAVTSSPGSPPGVTTSSTPSTPTPPGAPGIQNSGAPGPPTSGTSSPPGTTTIPASSPGNRNPSPPGTTNSPAGSQGVQKPSPPGVTTPSTPSTPTPPGAPGIQNSGAPGTLTSGTPGSPGTTTISASSPGNRNPSPPGTTNSPAGSQGVQNPSPPGVTTPSTPSTPTPPGAPGIQNSSAPGTPTSGTSGPPGTTTIPASSPGGRDPGPPGTYSPTGSPSPLRPAPPAAASSSNSPGVNKPGPPSTSNSPASSLGGPPGNTNTGVSSPSVQPPGAPVTSSPGSPPGVTTSSTPSTPTPPGAPGIQNSGAPGPPTSGTPGLPGTTTVPASSPDGRNPGGPGTTKSPGGSPGVHNPSPPGTTNSPQSAPGIQSSGASGTPTSGTTGPPGTTTIPASSPGGRDPDPPGTTDSPAGSQGVHNPSPPGTTDSSAGSPDVHVPGPPGTDNYPGGPPSASYPRPPGTFSSVSSPDITKPSTLGTSVPPGDPLSANKPGSPSSPSSPIIFGVPTLPVPPGTYLSIQIAASTTRLDHLIPPIVPASTPSTSAPSSSLISPSTLSVSTPAYPLPPPAFSPHQQFQITPSFPSEHPNLLHITPGLTTNQPNGIINPTSSKTVLAQSAAVKPPPSPLINPGLTEHPPSATVVPHHASTQSSLPKQESIFINLPSVSTPPTIIGQDFTVTIILSQQSFTKDLLQEGSLPFDQLKKAIEQAIRNLYADNSYFTDVQVIGFRAVKKEEATPRFDIPLRPVEARQFVAEKLLPAALVELKFNKVMKGHLILLSSQLDSGILGGIPVLKILFAVRSDKKYCPPTCNNQNVCYPACTSVCCGVNNRYTYPQSSGYSACPNWCEDFCIPSCPLRCCWIKK